MFRPHWTVLIGLLALSSGTAAAAEPEAAEEPEPEVPVEAAPLEETEQPGEVREVFVGSMFTGDDLPRVAGSAHVVTERELEREEHDDVHRMLGAVPGVYTRGEDGYGLRPNIGLRGANPDRSAKITLLEDGVLQGPAPYSAPAAYYFPLATRMVGLEVYKGPSSIRFGPNTIGGAINMRTRAIPDRHTAMVDAAAGRFGYLKGHGYYGTSHKGFGVLVEAAHVETSGFKDLPSDRDTGFRKNDTMLKLGYQTPSGSRIRHAIELKGGFGTEDSDETYLGITRDDFEAAPFQRYAASDLDNMNWWRSQAEVAYSLRQEDTIEVEARAYRHDFDRTWRRLDRFRSGPALTDVLANPDAGQAAVLAAILRGEQDALLPNQALLVNDNNRKFVSQGVQSVFKWTPKWGVVGNGLEVGARVHHDWIERNHTSDAFLMTSGALVPDGTDRLTVVNNRAESIAAAFHLVDAVTLWDRLTMAPGVRVEVISMRFDDALADTQQQRLDTPVTPGFGVLFSATDWLDVFAGVNRGFSPVSPSSPEDVRPEFAINYELGTRALFRELRAEAVGFVSDYSNLNGACTFSAGCIDGDGSEQFNAGSVLVWGLESLAYYRHYFDNGLFLEAGANYTYTGSRFSTTFTSAFPQWGDVEEGFQLPYVPNHQIDGMLAFGGRIWNVHASPGYTGAMRDVAGQGAIPEDERIDGFFLLDVGANVRVFERFKIYAQVNNATNNTYIASYRPFGIRPGAPLTFMIGIKAFVVP